MKLFVLAISILFALHSIPCSAQGISVQVGGDNGYYYDDDDYYDDSYSYWYGPGLYWGVYFDNEDDYYAYGSRHFPHHWHDHDHGGNNWHGGGDSHWHGSGGRGGGHGGGHH